MDKEKKSPDKDSWHARRAHLVPQLRRMGIVLFREGHSRAARGFLLLCVYAFLLKLRARRNETCMVERTFEDIYNVSMDDPVTNKNPKIG